MSKGLEIIKVLIPNKRVPIPTGWEYIPLYTNGKLVGHTYINWDKVLCSRIPTAEKQD